MSRETILIAEDEQYTRTTLALVLKNAGYDVLETTDGREALHLILACRRAAQPVDLIIVDIEMGGLTGWELLDALQQQQAMLPALVITGLTAHQTPRQITPPEWLGYLNKPFTPDTLIQQVRAMLQQAPLTGERIAARN